MLSRSCKQSEYFDKSDVARFVTCYICNGAFCDDSLRLDPTNSYYHKEPIEDLAGYPRYASFASNSKTLKRHSCESIASQQNFLKLNIRFLSPLNKAHY